MQIGAETGPVGGFWGLGCPPPGGDKMKGMDEVKVNENLMKKF